MATLTSPQTLPVRSARERYVENVYFQDGIVLTAILTALLYLILATSLDAAGYVDNMTLLAPVSLGALVLGFLMAFSRFDGFFALSHSMFTGLAWILFLMSGMVSPDEIAPFTANGIPEVQAQAYFVLLRWLNWIDAAINNVASNDNYIFVLEISFLIWWLTYLGVWSIFRYGYTWRAVVPAGVVLLVNTYYAPQPILGFLVVFCLVAMLLFVRTHLAEQQLRWRDQRIHYSPDVTFDFLRNGLAYSVVVVAMAWIIPGLGRSVEVRTVLAPLNAQWEETTQQINLLYQGLNRQTRPTASTFGSSLALGGARQVGDGVVFQAYTPIGRYWRAVVYDTFTGRQWVSSDVEAINLAANESAGDIPWNLRKPVTQTIIMAAPSGGMIFAAPDIISVSLPIAAEVRPLPVNNAEGNPLLEITSARSRESLETGDSYIVVSAQTQVTQRALEEAGTDYPADVVAQHLQLPEDFSERVAAEAVALTADLATPYAKVRAVETYLRSFTYNDDIEAPPPDRDPVEYFLYDIREGYCDYYATSMVVMLRSLGIPARTVSGYAEGRYDEEARLYYVTERDAHTWVEVYFPNYGWIEFEPTAGETQLNRPSGNEGDESALIPEGIDPSTGQPYPSDPMMDEQQPFDPDAPLPEDQAFTLEDAAGMTTDNWWFWALLTPLVLGVGLWIVWRTRISGPAGFSADVAPILFERLQRWAARLGLVTPVSHTPYEQAHQLTQVLPDGSVAINHITESYVRYRFSRHAVAPNEVPAAEQGTEKTADTTLQHDWEVLRPMLWRNWLRKLFGLRQGDPQASYALVKDPLPANGKQKPTDLQP